MNRMPRPGFVFLVVMLSAPAAHTQCLTSNTPALTAILQTTGDALLDQRINGEATRIGYVFGVQPKLWVYVDENGPNAIASPRSAILGATGEVFLGRTLLQKELRNVGEEGVAGIMAHEFGHILQVQRHSALSGPSRELQADFLAGYYLGAKNIVLGADVVAAAEAIWEQGDYQFTSPQHHGTPAQRVKAFTAGLATAHLGITAAYAEGERVARELAGTTKRNTDARDEDRERSTTPQASSEEENLSVTLQTLLAARPAQFSPFRGKFQRKLGASGAKIYQGTLTFPGLHDCHVYVTEDDVTYSSAATLRSRAAAVEAYRELAGKVKLALMNWEFDVEAWPDAELSRTTYDKSGGKVLLGLDARRLSIAIK